MEWEIPVHLLLGFFHLSRMLLLQPIHRFQGVTYEQQADGLSLHCSKCEESVIRILARKLQSTSTSCRSLEHVAYYWKKTESKPTGSCHLWSPPDEELPFVPPNNFGLKGQGPVATATLPSIWWSTIVYFTEPQGQSPFLPYFFGLLPWPLIVIKLYRPRFSLCFLTP